VNVRGRVEAIADVEILRLLIRRATAVNNEVEFEQALDALTKQP
jgi:hypothetical protein